MIRRVLKKFLPIAFLFLANSLGAESEGKLVQPIANNAVASAEVYGEKRFYSFNGLEERKDWRAVSNRALAYSPQSKKSWEIKSVPFTQGRLASISATVKNKVYLFGGYTVSEDHQEKSLPEVYRFDPVNESFELFTHMPVSVDDSVALVYKDRYIYLVSGWHDVGNVSTVQVLDTESKKWFYATPYPGAPVFGHAAGIVGNTMVIIDGVEVSGVKDGKRQFAMSPMSFIGQIDKNDFTKIRWGELPKHPGKAKYRAAAVGSKNKGLILFAAGSDNPYNYNGIGYNGKPSFPSKEVFAWELQTNKWIEFKALQNASMDHRGLIEHDSSFYILGGMGENQKVLDSVNRFKLKH